MTHYEIRKQRVQTLPDNIRSPIEILTPRYFIIQHRDGKEQKLDNYASFKEAKEAMAELRKNLKDGK